MTQISMIMTTSVRTIDVGEDLSAVREVLRKGDFHHLPVLDGEDLVGMISSRDLVRIYRDSSSTGFGKRDSDPTIAETMQTDLVTMRQDEKVERAIHALAEGAFHSLPIVDANDRLVGIVTNVDLLEYLFE